MKKETIEEKIVKMDLLFKSKASSPKETIKQIKQIKNQVYKKRPNSIRQYYDSVDRACPNCLTKNSQVEFEVVEVIRKEPFACYWKCHSCGFEGFHADSSNTKFDNDKSRFMTT